MLAHYVGDLAEDVGQGAEARHLRPGAHPDNNSWQSQIRPEFEILLSFQGAILFLEQQ